MVCDKVMSHLFLLGLLINKLNLSGNQSVEIIAHCCELTSESGL